MMMTMALKLAYFIITVYIINSLWNGASVDAQWT
jgi:hypothetical protein